MSHLRWAAPVTLPITDLVLAGLGFKIPCLLAATICFFITALLQLPWTSMASVAGWLPITQQHHFRCCCSEQCHRTTPPIWEANTLDEWLYNGGRTSQSFHFLIGVAIGPEVNSYRLGMRPWIFVAYSAPVAAATAVFLVYFGQGKTVCSLAFRYF